MDPLGSADNKGILSLLSAIEQTGDNFETDNQLAGLDIGLGLNKEVCSCLICGQTSVMEPSEQLNMVDISNNISGTKIVNKIEEIVSPRRISPEKQSSLICEDCYRILQQIDLLEVELVKYKRSITDKFSVSNPVKQARLSPQKAESQPLSSSIYTETIIDTKMPLQFLANDRDIERDIEHIQEQKRPRSKSKLDILTETMIECEEEDHLASCEEAQLSRPAQMTIFECDVCSRKFKNGDLYKKHVKTHSKVKTQHRCMECGKVFTSKSNMQAHLKLHFESKTFSCPHCAKEFKGKKSLLEHVATKHNNEKKFPCSQCPELFSSRHLKNVHERLHNGERGFICDQCGDSFATAQGLSHHKSKHTGDYQFVCGDCGKGFNNHKLLEEHSHTHTGSKPYQCSKCDKGFSNRGSLWVHVKQHEVDKPYSCSECQKTFSHSSHLSVHKRLHTGEKPYRCRLCSEAFISSNHLKRHMKSHPNQLPFACGNCKQTFSMRRQLVSHSNKVHGGNVVEDYGPDLAKEEDSVTFADTAMDAESEGYSLMPVSIVEGGMLGDTELHEQQRLVDLLGQDGVSLGQTIVLIQVLQNQIARPCSK